MIKKLPMLHLRALEPEDADYVFEIENDPSTWSAGTLLAPISRHSIAQMINTTPIISESTQLRYVLQEEESGERLGLFDLFNIDLINQNASIGLIIYPAIYRNKGFATAALSLLEDYAFRYVQLRSLYAEVVAENIPSLKLFLAANYEVIGTKKQWLRRLHNQYHDVVCLQKLYAPNGEH